MESPELSSELADLEGLEPGVVLAAMLSRIDVGQLSGHERVIVLRAHQRLASHYAAHVYRDIAAVAGIYEDLDEDPALAHDAAASEIRAALQLTRRAADAELGVAVELAERLPQVGRLLKSGRIDPRRARTILRHTAHLDADAARAVVDEILNEASRLTTGQLAARLRRLSIEVAPDAASRRYDQAMDQRRVVMEPTPDGTANLLGTDLPPDVAAAAMSRINRLARDLKTREESRTIDQLRADVMLDLLRGDGKAGGKGVIDIRVDLETLAEMAENPGDLAGYGPVVADIARQTADQQPDAEWRYTITDDRRAIGGGITRRRPTAQQQREVESRDTICVFPGCRMPAMGCDLDHRAPHAQGGLTRPDNLAPLCRHDHRIRHQAGWEHRPAPDGGHRWTSPLGHVHVTSGTPP